MRTLFFLLTILALISCKQSNKAGSGSLLSGSIPDDAYILTKTVALDSALSKNLKKCTDDPKEINRMSSCIIRKGNKQFIRDYTLILAQNGNIISLYRYLPEGPDVIFGEGLRQDTLLLNVYHLSLTNNIKINKKIGAIIDNGDTLPIIDHWKETKMLFVRSGPAKLPKGRALVYGYE